MGNFSNTEVDKTASVTRTSPPPPSDKTPSKSDHYQIKPEDKVSFSQRMYYSLPSFAFIPGMQTIDRIALVVLNMGLGINPTLVSLAMFVFRIWDGFTDPFMGNISDNCRSKWGRRRPFIILGAILCAVTFPLLWMMSREWSHMMIIIYFIGIGLAYYTAVTIFTVPYFSLITEMTPDTHERTNVLGFRQVVVKLVTIGMGWINWFITLEIFSDELEGIRWFAGITCLLFLVFGILPVLFIKEPFFEQAKKQAKIPLWQSIKVTLTNKHAMLLVAMMLMMTIGMQTVGTLGFYVSTYFVFGGDKAEAGKIAGIAGTSAMIFSVLTIPLFTWLSREYGKKVALYVNGILFLFATASQWFLVIPEHPYWQIISGTLVGPAVTGVWLILPSMQTDVVDEDELNTGCRREGSYTAVLGWIQKMGFALSVFLSGAILDFSGYDAALDQQPTDTLMNMRVLFVFFPIVMAAIMIALIHFYPLNEKRCLEIRERLEARRGEIHSQE
ncbi:MFS transporter [Planctomycetota bacterium]|nr:MFS transporter [Planctomycetota bacterium]